MDVAETPRARPRLLFLTCHLPYPPISGGRRRELELLRRIGQRYDVELCVVSKTFEEDQANAEILRENCSDVQIFPSDPGDAAASMTPAQVTRHRSPGLTAYVADRLDRGDIDLVHVEGFYLMQHVPHPSPVPVLLVEQNVEYVLWRQRTETSMDPRSSKVHFAEYLLTLEAETNAWRRADLCAALTVEDRQMMRDAAPNLDVRIVPDGLDHVSGVPSAPAQELPEKSGPVLVYVGNFAYQPNQDAAEYLCNAIFPRIRSRRPDVSLWLVGNAPPPEIRSLAGNRIVVTGRVADVAPFVDAADLFICPLRVGGGVKVKVLEALWRGKAVVTTSVGIQGLGPAVKGALVVEDQPGRFAHAVVRLLNRPKQIKRLEEAAQRFARTLPTWGDAARSLLSLYDELVPRSTEALVPRSTEAGSRASGVVSELA